MRCWSRWASRPGRSFRREWRELYGALDCAVVAAIYPFYSASVREFELAGRPIVGSAPVGVEGTAAWLEAIGEACGVPRARVDAAKANLLPAIKAALAQTPIQGRVTLSGYEGSELLVARLMIEAARMCATSERLAHVRDFRKSIARGSRPGVSTSSSARLSSTISRRWSNTSLISRSARRQWCRRRSEGSVALFHEPDFRAPAYGRGRRWLDGESGQRRYGQQRPL